MLATLEFLAASGLRPTVTSLDLRPLATSPRRATSRTTRRAARSTSRKINGIPILGHQGEGSVTDLTVRRLLTLQGTMQPAADHLLMTYEGSDNTLAMGDHDDHIHVGFTPTRRHASRPPARAPCCKPGQWIKLIDRLGEIDNPTVAAKPSASSITVVEPRRRGSRGHRGE